MALELVVLDLAGTTVADFDSVADALIKAVGTVGVKASVAEANRVMGMPKPLAIRLLLEEHRHPSADSDQEVSRIYAQFEQNMLNYYRMSVEVQPIDGAEEAMRWMQAHGIKVALDTGFSPAIAEAIIQRFEWTWTDALVCSTGDIAGRPHPDMIWEAMRRTGVTDSLRVAKVGDTPVDLQQGSSAGCAWVVGVLTGTHTEEQLRLFPHTHIVKSVADLPGLFTPALDRAEAF